MECTNRMIPVTTGANGTISKSLKKYLTNVLGKHDVPELNKRATLGTAHTAGSVGVLYKGFIVGYSIILVCTVYCNNRIAVTLYSVGTWFVSGL